MRCNWRGVMMDPIVDRGFMAAKVYVRLVEQAVSKTYGFPFVA